MLILCVRSEVIQEQIDTRKNVGKLEHDSGITLQSLSEEFLNIINRKHDSAQKDGAEMKMEIQSKQNMPGNDHLQIIVMDAVVCILQ